MALFKSLWLQIFSRAAWHEETFTAASAQYRVIIVDSVRPTSSVDALTASKTVSFFPVNARMGGIESGAKFWQTVCAPPLTIDPEALRLIGRDW